MVQSQDEKKRLMLIQEAKEIACDITGKKDFAFISKVELAIIVRNLVEDFHKKKDEIARLQGQLVEIKKGINILKQEGEVK